MIFHSYVTVYQAGYVFFHLVSVDHRTTTASSQKAIWR